MEAIKGFHGEYRFLSNFYYLPEPIVETYDDKATGETHRVSFTTLEHAYQASKYRNLGYKFQVADCETPGQAKRMGRRYAARPDWEAIKLDVMLYFTRRKYEHPQMKAKLLATGSRDLIEVNNHGDVYWGTDEFLDGENHLGLILMQVRQELSNQI